MQGARWLTNSRKPSRERKAIRGIRGVGIRRGNLGGWERERGEEASRCGDGEGGIICFDMLLVVTGTGGIICIDILVWEHNTQYTLHTYTKTNEVRRVKNLFID